MICKILCSVGEVYDKITILNIKKNKTTNISKLNNINKELDLLIEVTNDIKIPDKLYNELYNINLTLWDYENNIRFKSSKKEFDNEYIYLAENIHISNDKRYLIKKKINDLFDSVIKEEKIYNDLNNDLNNKKNILHDKIIQSKNHFTNGEFIESYNILKNIIYTINFKNNITHENIDILVSYLTVCLQLKKQFEFLDIYQNILKNTHILNINDEYILHIKKTYLYYILYNNDYTNSLDYLKCSGCVSIYNLNYENTCFIENDDDVLFLYMGGGLGDHIMFVRLIKILKQYYPSNKIIYLTLKPIKWLIKYILKDLTDITIITSKEEFDNMNLLKVITKHCSLLELFKFLNLTKEYLYNNFTPLLKNITLNNNNNFNIKNIKNNSYIFNWKGNSINIDEKYSRKMDLHYAEKLFSMTHIQFIIINKDDISEQEKNIINKYSNVYFIGNKIDLTTTFYDTIHIMRKVKGVITTDTSIIHLAANLNVLSYLCLTYSHEWRWGNLEKSIWYPNINLLRQKEINNWDTVIDELSELIF
tara:strand:- start:1656 stop:3257 length:1602 start_codon:yes stop_codon:yes gene_type:complete